MVAFEYASARRSGKFRGNTAKRTRTEDVRVVVEDCIVVSGVKSVCNYALCRPGLGGCVIDVDGGGVRSVRVEDVDRVRELRGINVSGVTEVSMAIQSRTRVMYGRPCK